MARIGRLRIWWQSSCAGVLGMTRPSTPASSPHMSPTREFVLLPSGASVVFGGEQMFRARLNGPDCLASVSLLCVQSRPAVHAATDRCRRGHSYPGFLGQSVGRSPKLSLDVFCGYPARGTQGARAGRAVCACVEHPRLHKAMGAVRIIHQPSLFIPSGVRLVLLYSFAVEATKE